MDTKNEIIISSLLVLLLILLLNPFGFWMPDEVVYITVAGLFILVIIFAGFAWKEDVRDEREQLHKQIAGRVGYLAGLFVLLAGIVVESIDSHPSKWLILAIGSMVLGKLFGHYWAKRKN